MKFGWINAFGAVIVILMLIPNVIYAIRNAEYLKTDNQETKGAERYAM